MVTTVLPTGTLLNKGSYRIETLLGRGGYGAVYRARDLIMGGKLCAIKENLEDTPQAHRQFLTEARILATLKHDNLVHVTDNFIEPSGKMYLVMEYVEGEDLQDRLERLGPLPEADVLAWLDQVLVAVDYLHTYSPPIVHRDIKPANIRVLPDGQTAKLVDFGIAKVGGPKQPTATTARGVSDGFSPPEQYGSGTDTYSDVYALGATMYTLLTDQIPTPPLEREYHNAPFPAPRALKPSIRPATEAVILKAMELKPAQRYQTAGEMRQALQASLGLVACPHCGRSTRATSQFCQACGRPVGPTTLGRAPKAAAQAYSAASAAGPATGLSLDWRAYQRWQGAFNPRAIARFAGIGAVVGMLLGFAPALVVRGGALVDLAVQAGAFLLTALGAVVGTLVACREDVDRPNFLPRLGLVLACAALVTLLLGGMGMALTGGGLAAALLAGGGAVAGAVGGAWLVGPD